MSAARGPRSCGCSVATEGPWGTLCPAAVTLRRRALRADALVRGSLGDRPGSPSSMIPKSPAEALYRRALSDFWVHTGSMNVRASLGVPLAGPPGDPA